MIEDRIYLFIYLVYISCLGDKKVRCLWGFSDLRVYGLEHQTRQTTRIKSVQFCTPILLIKTHEYFLWNRIEFRCEVICTFKMIYNSKYRIA